MQGDARRRRSAPAPASALFLGFGLASLVVAVPFLWRALPWKRLLAYSSLEHMGVLALGIGFGTPLAIAGVVRPRRRPRARQGARVLRRHAAAARTTPTPHQAPLAGVAAASPPTAAAMGVSLGALAALPPSPLFVPSC